MPKISKPVVDADLRARVFDSIGFTDNNPPIEFEFPLTKINDTKYGVLLTDLNGTERYVRIGAIVAEEREDMTARELMQSEINAYNEAQADKAEKKRRNAEKAKRDKAKREKEKAEKEAKKKEEGD